MCQHRTTHDGERVLTGTHNKLDASMQADAKCEGEWAPRALSRGVKITSKAVGLLSNSEEWKQGWLERGKDGWQCMPGVEELGSVLCASKISSLGVDCDLIKKPSGGE